MTTPAGGGGGAGRGAARNGEDDGAIPVGAHHGGSFGLYMRHKTERLQQQFHDVEAVASRLFEGMVFHVNGLTDVPIEELRRQIVLHGGRVEQYASSRVTHILCKHLPHAKIRELTAQKLARGAHQQVPIVQPRFVQDCLDAGKRLPHAPYLVDGLRERHGQSLQGFFQPQQQPQWGQDDDGGDGGGKLGARGEAKGENKEGEEGTAMDVDRDDAGAVATAATAVAQAWPGKGSSSAAGSPQQPVAVAGKSAAASSAAAAAAAAAAASPAVSSSPSARASSRRSSTSSTSTSPGGGGGGGRPPWRDGGPPLSTKDDPQFLARYYETSRLHWIGSFKAKLMQRLGDEAVAKFKAAGGATRPAGGLVLHIDLDCFFVSALVRDRPELQGKPLAVAHADGGGGGGGGGAGHQSSSEISSCNYPARAKGVRAAMFLGEARRLCPDLVVLRYDFGVYESVARHVYRIFFEEAAVVQPVSCDEAFLELPPTARTAQDGEAAAARIRARILAETGCPASAGLSTNMLLARLATKQAKPDGQRALFAEEAAVWLESLPVTDLPGVGWHLGKALEGRGITTCGEVQRRAGGMAELQEWFGDKTGRMLWDRCRGEDARRVAPEMGGPKSLGAEVNWGVRFDEAGQVETFLQELAAEVERRLARARVRGRQVVLKVKRSQYGPNEPEKLLGCGRCDNFSRSLMLPRATGSARDIATAALQLLRPLRVPPNLLRGLGIQMCKLEAEQQQQPESPGAGEGGLGAWLQGKKRASPGAAAEGGYGAKMTAAAAAPVDGEQQQQEAAGGDESESSVGGYGSGWELATPSPKKKARAAAQAETEAGPGNDVEVVEVTPRTARARRQQQPQQHAQQQSQQQQQPHSARTRTAAAAAASPPAETAEHWLLSLSQLDEEVLAGLPAEVQREVREAARPSAAVVAAASSFASSSAAASAFNNPPRPVARARSGRQLRVDAYDTRALQAEGADAEHLAALPPLVRVELNEQFLRGGRRLLMPQQAGVLGASGSPSVAVARAASLASASASASAPSPAAARKGKKPLQRHGSLPRQGGTPPKRPFREQQEGKGQEGEGDVVVVVAMDDAGAAATASASQRPQRRRRRRPPRLFVVEDVAEVRRALGRWLREIADPQPAHFRLLVVYLSELLDDGRADDAWLLMRALRRWAAEGAPVAVRPAWRAGYRRVLAALTEWLRTKAADHGGGGAGVCWAGLQLREEEA